VFRGTLGFRDTSVGVPQEIRKEIKTPLWSLRGCADRGRAETKRDERYLFVFVEYVLP
jgi:hypothetical protein